MKRRSVLVALIGIVFAISCGDTSDKEASNNRPNNAQPGDLPIRDGLDSDADNQRLLFYTNSTEDGPGLYAFDPNRPDNGGILVDGDLYLDRPHHHPMFSGDFDPTTQSISDYHVADVYYSTYGTPDPDDPLGFSTIYGELWKISTDPARLADGPTKISDLDTSGLLYGDLTRILSYDFQDPEKASLAIGLMDGWVRVRMGYDDSRASDKFGENISVISAVFSAENKGGGGYIVIDHDADAQGISRRLQRWDDDLNLAGAIHYKDTGEPVVDVEGARWLTDFYDGTELLFLRIGSSDPGTVWLYESGEANGGTVKQLLNSAGEPMIISFMIGGLGSDEKAISPPTEHMTRASQKSLYFANGPEIFSSSWTQLYRIDHDGWAVYNHKDHNDGGRVKDSELASFLIGVGEDRLFWSLGDQPEVVDVSDPDPNQWVRTPIEAPGASPKTTPVGSGADGWVYYNTVADEAVAVNVDTGESLLLENTKWIGTSNAPEFAFTGGLGAHLHPSEVFLLQDGRYLAALEAKDPLAGMVPLGDLGENAHEVGFAGKGSGPHRLLRTVYDDGSIDILYINTRHRDSLKKLTLNPVTDWTLSTELPGGMGTDSRQIWPEITRPIEGF